MKPSRTNFESPDIEIRVLPDMDELARSGAELFCRAAGQAVTRDGRFAVALSGGSTPRPMHRLLAERPFVDKIPWDSSHLFWIDERLVGYDEPASNFGTAAADFLSQVPIPRPNVHPMPIDQPPEQAAAAYQEMLKNFFAQEPAFDLIYLGVGEDGHVASLFPGKDHQEAPDCWVLADKGGRPDVWRLSLTYTLLNQAKQIVFLVCGSSKAPIVQRLFENGGERLPAQRIASRSGKLTWLLDKAAVSLLSKPLATR
jgi:6-phosphogluconolactonase